MSNKEVSEAVHDAVAKWSESEEFWSIGTDVRDILDECDDIRAQLPSLRSVAKDDDGWEVLADLKFSFEHIKSHCGDAIPKLEKLLKWYRDDSLAKEDDPRGE